MKDGGALPGLRGRPLRAAVVAIILVTEVVGLAVLSLPAPTVNAAGVSLALYGTYLGGWSFTPGGETNPGPTISVTVGDRVTVHLLSEDAAQHGLFIDFNDNGRIDGGDYSSITGTDVTFTFTIPSAAGSHHYYCSIHSPDVNGYYVPGAPMYGVFFVNERPSATYVAPTPATSWTGGTPHDIVFNLADEDPPTSLTVWVNYSYNGGAQTGAIIGPVPGTANPNVVPWTPIGFSATDVKINVTAVDTRGAYGSSASAPFEVDSTPPTIVAQSPAPDAVGVTLNTKIRVTWSEGMNTIASGASDAFAVRRVSDGVWIPGTETWSPDGTLMTFTPAAPWDITTTFEVNVNATAKDDSDPGNAFAGPTAWRFTTGTVADAMPPVITNAVASPATQEAGGSVTIMADVTDDVAVASVSAHVTGLSTDVNLTMANPSGSTWSASRTYAATGSYAFTVWALDTSGNAASKTGSFAIQDRTSPVIASVAATPTSTTPGGAINVTAVASDNGALASVAAHVIGPSFDTNLSMARASGSTWFVNRTYTGTGSYAFSVWAVDAAGNAASKTGSFSISQAPPPPAPSMVVAQPVANGTIRVTWSAVTSGTLAGYNVYRGAAASGPFSKLTSTPTPASSPLEYVDRAVQGGATYYYVVTSVDGNGNESPFSSIASATAAPAAPAPQFDPLPWILVIVVVASVVLVVAFLLRRRKR